MSAVDSLSIVHNIMKSILHLFIWLVDDMKILAHKQHEACFQLVCNGQEKASIAVRHKEEEGAIARLPLKSKVTTDNESK